MGERFSVGSIECQILSDGEGHYEVEHIFGNVKREELDPLLAGQIDEQGLLHVPYRCLLIKTGDRIALVDSGLGEIAAQIGWPAGKLSASLREAGVSPQDIDTVIVSHAHPDHIGGLTRQSDGNRVPVYGKATHHFWAEEWRFWTSEEGLAQVPDMLADPARMTLPPLAEAGVVETVDAETELLPGVVVVPAPGHTPGHMAVVITSGGKGALYLADTVLHALEFEHLEWLSPFDAIPNLTVETRRRLLDRAVRENRSVVGFHLAGRGTVSSSGEAFSFRPVEAAS